MLRSKMLIVLSLVLLTGLTFCKGPTGPQGPPGNTTVIVDTFSIADSSDIQTDRWYGVYNHPMRSISKAVVDSGVVLAYLGSSSQDVWTALPYDLDFDAESDFTVDYTVSVNFVYTTGNFNVTFEASADTLFTGNLPLGPYKVVVIPPGTTGQLGKADLQRYESVRQALDLPR